uniref:Uncharacterized protein n=1 Tax=Caenorhabditis japonica TaxID=281687 RepID=A0A8R1EJ51_CAEJA
MLSMVFRAISLKTFRFPTSGAFAMCFLAYLIPLSMIVCVRDIEITSDFTTNSNYTLWQLENLDKYNTVVGTHVSQLSALWVACCVSVLFIPIYSVMFYCRYRILRMLEHPGYLFNATTTLQIRRLVKVTAEKKFPK